MQAITDPTRARRMPLLAAAFAALLLAQPAVAQDTSTKKGAAVKSTPKNKANLMTRDELRACMNEQDRLQQLRAKFEQEQAGVDQDRGQIQAMDAELQKKAAALDPADEAARKALEEDAVRRDQAADAHNARLAAMRQQGETYNAGRQAWAERCTRKDYDELDEAAIKKERQQAAKARK